MTFNHNIRRFKHAKLKNQSSGRNVKSPFSLQLPRKDITDGYPSPHEERFNNPHRVHNF